MIIFPTFWVLTFYTCTCFWFFTNKAFMLISLLFDILNTSDINGSILLFKIALRNPNWAYIMNPNIMTRRLILWISSLIKVIIIKFLLLLCILILLLLLSYFLRLDILLLLLIIRTSLRVLIVSGISFFP